MEPNNPNNRVTTHAPPRTWCNSSNSRTETPKLTSKAPQEFAETRNGTAALTAGCEDNIMGHTPNPTNEKDEVGKCVVDRVQAPCCSCAASFSPAAQALQLNDVPSHKSIHPWHAPAHGHALSLSIIPLPKCIVDKVQAPCHSYAASFRLTAQALQLNDVPSQRSIHRWHVQAQGMACLQLPFELHTEPWNAVGCQRLVRAQHRNATPTPQENNLQHPQAQHSAPKS